MMHVNDPIPRVDVNDVYRKLHSDRMNTLRRRYPKTFSRCETFGGLAKQSFHSRPRSISKLDL